MATPAGVVTALLALAACLCSAFGNSLEPVGLLALLQPLLALIAYDRLVLLKPAWGEQRPRLWHLIAAAILTFGNALGGTVAFAGVLSFPATTATSLAAAFGFALAISSLTTVVTLLGMHLACNKWPGSIVPVLTFPCLSTCTHTLTAFVISSFVSAGNAVMDYEPLRQMCAVWGLAGTVFLMNAAAAIAYLHVAAASPAFVGRSSLPAASRKLAYEQLPSAEDTPKPGNYTSSDTNATASASAAGTGHPRIAFGTPLVTEGVSPPLYRVTVLLLLAWCLVATLGGLLSQGDLFYQVDITTILPRTIQVSCLIESSEDAGSPGWDRLWARTEARLALGDDLVMWAEEAVNTSYGIGEEQLLEQARRLIYQHGNRSYLGLSYQALHSDSGMYSNHFTLMQPNGAIAWNYRKAYPVPVVEAEVIPGPAILPIHDSPFGRLSGAICFDLDHAHFAVTAAQQSVDIMLQPSWTWGSVGPRHFVGNQLRSIEGGFSIIRCSSSGVSGVVTPGGVVTAQARTGSSDQVVFTVPLFPHRWTPYVHMGLHYVELLNLGLAALMWLAIVLPQPPAAWWAGLARLLPARLSSNHAVSRSYRQWQTADPEEQPLGQAASSEGPEAVRTSSALHMSSAPAAHSSSRKQGSAAAGHKDTL